MSYIVKVHEDRSTYMVEPISLPEGTIYMRLSFNSSDEAIAWCSYPNGGKKPKGEAPKP